MENAITRRDALKLTATATTLLVSGGALVMIAGCGAKSTADSPGNAEPAPSETSFRVEDGKWFSDWTEETKQGIPFTGSKLGIVPSGDGETLAIAYCNADGVKQVTQIGPANAPVRVHGDIEMLAADDIASRYVVLVDEDATIDALFLGGIDRAEVSGSIASLIVAGKADAELRAESSVQSVIMGDSRADVRVDAGALVSEVYAPYAEQVEFESVPCAVRTVDADYASQANKAFVRVLTGQGTEDERAFVLGLCADLELPPVVVDAADAAKTSAAAFPVSLGPEKAYADEADKANASSAASSQADTASEDTDDADAAFSDKEELTSDDPEWSRLEDFQPDPDTPIDEDCIELPTDEELAAANQDTENDIPFVQGDIDTILKGVANLTLNKTVTYATNTLLSAIFGSNNGVERALGEISARLDNIEREIQAVYTAIQEAELCSIINELIKTYFRNTTDLVDFIEKFNHDYMKDFQEGTDDYIAARKRVAMYLATASSAENPRLTVDGKTVDAYAIDYCSALLAEQVGVALNPLEAYFKLSLLKSPWEQNTIAGRVGFQDEVVNKFGLLCGYAAFALRGYMDYLVDDVTLSDEKRKVEISQCIASWEQLFGTDSANEIANDYGVTNEFSSIRATRDNESNSEEGYATRASRLIESYKVVPHADKWRHFMVPGKEVTLMTQAAVLKVNKSTGANQPQLTVSSDTHLVADIDSFRKIYDYYGGKKTLHQILFSQDEASIALPDAGKKEDYSFSVSGVEPKADRYIKSKGAIEHSQYYTPVVSGKMKLSQRNYYNYDNNRGSKTEKYFDITLLGVYEKLSFED
ncbi:hypothetical protein [uncultured Ellagibacter sp.]|uniref:hypothetical protein n=1 Tax=uncultured Ellagibacter sp. TaxID=2137580 RepID=UPI0026130191|nr:hypothetical protein [uncultured Ellagibacter sp.]